MSGYKATRLAMGDMAKSLERDPQLESILEGRKRDLGIGIDLRISINGVGWKESDINRWVENPVAWRPVNDNDDPGGKAAGHDAG